jgi:hypothetical protein
MSRASARERLEAALTRIDDADGEGARAASRSTASGQLFAASSGVIRGIPVQESWVLT